MAPWLATPDCPRALEVLLFFWLCCPKPAPLLKALLDLPEAVHWRAALQMPARNHALLPTKHPLLHTVYKSKAIRGGQLVDNTAKANDATILSL